MIEKVTLWLGLQLVIEHQPRMYTAMGSNHSAVKKKGYFYRKINISSLFIYLYGGFKSQCYKKGIFLQINQHIFFFQMSLWQHQCKQNPVTLISPTCNQLHLIITCKYIKGAFAFFPQNLQSYIHSYIRKTKISFFNMKLPAIQCYLM